MGCPTCNAENPEFAAFCHLCGQGLRGADSSRQRDGAYALQSSERVHQLALISTIMPHSSRETADNYRWSLLITGVLALAFSLTGILPAAVLAAAFLVPLTYLVYIYDVNLWEDTPLPVVGGLFLFTGLLSTIISIVFFRLVFDNQFLGLALSSGERGPGLGGLPFVSLLLFALVLPVIAEVAKNVGPVLLSRMPQFDDQIDALTFGIASGTAYAAFETVVSYAPVFASNQMQTTEGLASWLVVILNLMIVKSLIYGTATGIALASFSGRGAGVVGFSPNYFTNFGLAVGANVLYWLGIRLLAYAPFGQALALLWGLAILALLILRIRTMMHSALLEVAVEDARAGQRSTAATTDGGVCPECHIGLLADAMFCIVCGSSVRATSHQARRHIREASPAGGTA